MGLLSHFVIRCGGRGSRSAILCCPSTYAREVFFLASAWASQPTDSWSPLGNPPHWPLVVTVSLAQMFLRPRGPARLAPRTLSEMYAFHSPSQPSPLCENASKRSV